MNTKYKCEQCKEWINGIERRDHNLILEQYYKCHKCGFCRHWKCGHLMMDDSKYQESVNDNE